MNSAARFLNQSGLTRGLSVSLFWTKEQFSTVVLIVAVLASALGIVYSENVSRSIHASIQRSLTQQEQIHVQRAQLLLERSTWMVPARVEELAEKNYDMVVPDSKSVVIVD